MKTNCTLIVPKFPPPASAIHLFAQILLRQQDVSPFPRTGTAASLCVVPCCALCDKHQLFTFDMVSCLAFDFRLPASTLSASELPVCRSGTRRLVLRSNSSRATPPSPSGRTYIDKQCQRVLPHFLKIFFLARVDTRPSYLLVFDRNLVHYIFIHILYI